MNIKEIRVGNLIEVEGNNAEIRTIDPHQISYTFQNSREFAKYNQQLDEIKFIPITDEWLLKLGFEKLPSYWLLHVNELIHLHIYLYPNIRPHVELFAGEYIEGDSAIIPILYVHQLQNLVYGLTCEELQIKA